MLETLAQFTAHIFFLRLTKRVLIFNVICAQDGIDSRTFHAFVIVERFVIYVPVLIRGRRPKVLPFIIGSTIFDVCPDDEGRHEVTRSDIICIAFINVVGQVDGGLVLTVAWIENPAVEL